MSVKTLPPEYKAVDPVTVIGREQLQLEGYLLHEYDESQQI